MPIDLPYVAKLFANKTDIKYVVSFYLACKIDSPRWIVSNDSVAYLYLIFESVELGRRYLSGAQFPIRPNLLNLGSDFFSRLELGDVADVGPAESHNTFFFKGFEQFSTRTANHPESGHLWSFGARFRLRLKEIRLA
jgi:hypothetical protein